MRSARVSEEQQRYGENTREANGSLGRGPSNKGQWVSLRKQREMPQKGPKQARGGAGWPEQGHSQGHRSERALEEWRVKPDMAPWGTSGESSERLDAGIRQSP